MSRGKVGTRIRTTAAVRAGWAVILLALPEPLLRAGGGSVSPAAAAAVRVLGVRHLLQAGASAARPQGSVAGLGALVDTMHAGSCVGLAVASTRWRRVALVDALVEAGFAAAGWNCWGPASPSRRSAVSPRNRLDLRARSGPPFHLR